MVFMMLVDFDMKNDTLMPGVALLWKRDMSKMILTLSSHTSLLFANVIPTNVIACV